MDACTALAGAWSSIWSPSWRSKLGKCFYVLVLQVMFSCFKTKFLSLKTIMHSIGRLEFTSEYDEDSSVHLCPRVICCKLQHYEEFCFCFLFFYLLKHSFLFAEEAKDVRFWAARLQEL